MVCVKDKLESAGERRLSGGNILLTFDGDLLMGLLVGSIILLFKKVGNGEDTFFWNDHWL
jgi:hypothetical protein